MEAIDNGNQKYMYRCGKMNYFLPQVCTICNLEKDYTQFKKCDSCKRCRVHIAYLKYKAQPGKHEQMTQNNRKRYYEMIANPLQKEKSQKRARDRYLLKKQQNIMSSQGITESDEDKQI